jgi:hypothetical protein
MAAPMDVGIILYEILMAVYWQDTSVGVQGVQRGRPAKCARCIAQKLLSGAVILL